MTIRHIAVSLFVCLAALLLFSAPASAQTKRVDRLRIGRWGLRI